MFFQTNEKSVRTNTPLVSLSSSVNDNFLIVLGLAGLVCHNKTWCFISLTGACKSMLLCTSAPIPVLNNILGKKK